MKIKVGDLFRNPDENYTKSLEVLELLPNNVFKVSYDPDFRENEFFMTLEELKKFQPIKQTQ